MKLSLLLIIYNDSFLALLIFTNLVPNCLDKEQKLLSRCLVASLSLNYCFYVSQPPVVCLESSSREAFRQQTVDQPYLPHVLHREDIIPKDRNGRDLPDVGVNVLISRFECRLREFQGFENLRLLVILPGIEFGFPSLDVGL